MSERAAQPRLQRIVDAFPGGPTRGEVLDWLLFRTHRLWERFAHWITRRRRTPPHPRLLAAAVGEILRAFPEPVCVETGCIREPGEGTMSTRAISSALERGRLYSFDLEPRHIAICKQVCEPYNDRIEYVQGDAKEELRRLNESGVLAVVHLALLDSMNDADQIWAEFRAIEDRFVPGSVVIVDDSVPPSKKGRRVKPYLHRHPLWETHLVRSGRGLLVAVRRDESDRSGARGATRPEGPS